MGAPQPQHCPVCGLPVEQGITAAGLGPQERSGTFPVRALVFHPACAFGHATSLLSEVRQRAWRPGAPMDALEGPPHPNR